MKGSVAPHGSTASLIPNVEEQDQDLSRVEASTEG
jgi:hypothetical protein